MIELCSEYLSVRSNWLYVLVMSRKRFRVNPRSIVAYSWVFIYELSGSGFESSCSNLNFRFWACFKQGVPWHLGKYSVWIHYEMHTWHDKNIQSVRLFLFVIFPDIWKEINVNSYRLIGLLPIFIKNLKRIKRIVLLLATKDYDIWYQ